MAQQNGLFGASSSKIVIWPLTSQKLSSGWKNCKSLGRNPFSATSAIRGQASYFPYSPSKAAAQGMAARTLCLTHQIFCGCSGPPSRKETARSHSCINIWGSVAITLPPGSLGPLSMCAATKGEMLEPQPHSQWALEREQLQLLSHGVAAGVQQRSWLFRQPLCSSLHTSLSHQPAANSSSLSTGSNN